MKVLFIGAEANPFIKTGGLGDVLGALPKSLVRQGIDARVIIPKYKDIDEKLKEGISFIKWFTVDVGWRKQYCGVFEYEENGVKYYLIDNEYYFGRSGVYGYFDDGERYAFFNRAVLNLLKEIDYKPDILHCNDWHTGMVAPLLNLEYKKDLFYINMKTIFSIHNLRFQGIFEKDILKDFFGYDMEPYYNGTLAFDGGISFMKGGIVYSDKVLTVSNTYAEEIKSQEFGDRLDSVLRGREEDLKGIVNGIDYDEFNPENDKHICRHFSKNNLSGKKKNKEELQRILSLPIRDNSAMIGVVSRLTNQKGLDIIVDMADRLLQHDVQLVILGTGEAHYENHFKGLADRYRDKVSVNIKFDNILAHKIYSGCDMFLMPSLFEPCGLGQLIALRYGTIPIVREIGGLKDTIIPYNKYTREGNGFSFRNYNGNELLSITEYALDIFRNKEEWENIVNHALESNNSWEKSAKDYISLYYDVLKCN